MPNPRVPCDVTACGPTTIIVFDRESALMLRQEPDGYLFFQAIEEQLSRALLILWARNVVISSYTISDRVMAFLELRRAETGSDEIDFPQPLDDFASYLACERTALSRTISRLCAEGKIARKGRGRLELL